MRMIVLVFSAAWLAIAITVVYAPGYVPEWLVREELGPWMRKLAVFPLAAGVSFMFASRRMRLGAYLFIIGALAVLKGLFFLVLPAKAAQVLIWYANLSVTELRVMGTISIALALPVVIAAFISLFEENIL